MLMPAVGRWCASCRFTVVRVFRRDTAFYGMTYYLLYPFQNFTNLAEYSIGIMYLKVKEMLILLFHRFLKSKFSDALFTSKIVAFLAILKVIATQSVSTFCSLIENRDKLQIL